MVKKKNREIVLMSIHPKFAKKILSGQKLVEFRKTKLAKDVKYILIYATSPQKKIVGYFKVDGIDIDTPKSIWDKYANVGCVEKKFYWTYYSNSNKAIAIKVGSVFELKNPLEYSSIFNINPPQNFYYINNNTINLILNQL